MSYVVVINIISVGINYYELFLMLTKNGVVPLFACLGPLHYIKTKDYLFVQKDQREANTLDAFGPC